MTMMTTRSRDKWPGEASPDDEGPERRLRGRGLWRQPEPDDNLIQADDKDPPARRETRVKTKNEHVSRFRCDEVSGEWCEDSRSSLTPSIPKIPMLSLVQHAIRKALVQYIDGVGGCTFVSAEKMQDLPAAAEEC